MKTLSKWLMIPVVFLLLLFLLFQISLFSNPSVSHLSAVGTPTIDMQIYRSGKWLQNTAEGSWFVWGGQLYYVYTARNNDASQKIMKIVRFSDNVEIVSFANGFGFQSVIVIDGVLYIFASDVSWENANAGWGSKIVRFATPDLVNFFGPDTILQMPSNRMVVNTTIARNGNTYVLGYESKVNGGSWDTRFLTSTDFNNWSATGSVLTTPPGVGSSDASCPYLTFIDGYYYIWVATTLPGPKYVVPLARSANLTSWSWSRLYTIKPIFEFEDINTTDLDFIEYNNEVYLLYTVSDQQTYQRITYAKFKGIFVELVQAYFI